MKKVWVRYKLENGKPPKHIIDGGYYPDGDFLYGVSLLTEVPDKKNIIKKKDFEDKVAVSAFFKEIIVPMTEEEKRAQVRQDFLLKEIEDDEGL